MAFKCGNKKLYISYDIEILFFFLFFNYYLFIDNDYNDISNM